MGLNKNYILTSLGNAHMIIPLVNARYDMSKVFNINEVGALIYKALLDDKSDDEILELILNEYDVDKAVAMKDILDFKNSLIEKGIYNA